MAILPCDFSLIAIHISDCCQFSDIHISRGSVATYLWCGGIFKRECVANLPLSLEAVKKQKNENLLIFGKLWAIFLTHGVHCEYAKPASLKILCKVMSTAFCCCSHGFSEVVREDCQARKLNKEDAMDRCKWRKMIKEAR